MGSLSVLLQTSPGIIGSVVTLLISIALLVGLIAILSVFIKWAIGTSEIIRNQYKIITLLEQISNSTSIPKCPKCNQPNSGKFKYCIKCGNEL